MFPKRFYDYNTFLRQRFDGQKVYKISLDAGFTCPNIDGTVATGGCIYCDNDSFSPAHQPDQRSLREQMTVGMKLVRRRFKAQKFIAYLQSYTNTHAPVDCLERLYADVLDHPDVVGLAIGTRPDAVDADKLDLIAAIAQDYFVSLEYGVQTKNDTTLRWINRGHTYEDFLQAMTMTKARGIFTCAHLMFGFPNETREEMLDLAAEMNRIGVNAVKLHNLLIIRGTKLAEMYAREPFPILSYNDHLDLVCDFIERLSLQIVVERLFAGTGSDYQIAPTWRLRSSSQVTFDVTTRLTERGTWQGCRLELCINE